MELAICATQSDKSARIADALHQCNPSFYAIPNHQAEGMR